MLILEGAGGLPRPGGEIVPPPGQELLGVITSRGPSRESYNSMRKATGAGEAGGPPAAGAAVSAEGMRASISSAAVAPALLQRGLPGSGAEVVAVEGAATLPGDGRGQAETERPKPALPGAGAQPGTRTARGG